MGKKNIIITVCLIALIVLAASVAGTWYYNNYIDGNDEKKAMDNKEKSNENKEKEEKEQEEYVSKYSWIVEPEFDYDIVYFCVCGELIAITDEEYMFVDDSTGEITGEHYGHGGGGNTFIVFNNQIERYGIYESEDGGGQINFTENSFIDIYDEMKAEWSGYLQYISNTFAVLETSSSKDVLSSEDGDEWEFGKIAYATKDGLITEFIFDDFDSNITTEFPAVAKGVGEKQKWGFIDNKGNQIVDFIFEGAVSIDDETAFVKKNGKWGIISKI